MCVCVCVCVCVYVTIVLTEAVLANLNEKDLFLIMQIWESGSEESILQYIQVDFLRQTIV